MADTMHFDLVSPERRLVSVDAREIGLPGADGDLTVMAGHAPTITTLRPGILRVVTDKGETDYTVTGGFAEVTGTTCTVLAERSHAVSDMTQPIFDDMMADVRARHAAVMAQPGNGPTDEVVKLMADMVAMGSRIGLEPRD
jgi:F-type H+-transporting ATPase subunit epsilon